MNKWRVFYSSIYRSLVASPLSSSVCSFSFHCDHILHSVCTASLVPSFVSFTNPAIALNLRIHHQPADFTCQFRSEHLLWYTSISHALIQEALTTRHNCPLVSQPVQGNPPLPLMARAHSVRDDINPMSLTQQVQRRLRDADMSLNANNSDLIRFGRALRENEAELWYHHGEGGFVDCVDGSAIWIGEFRAERTKASGRLGGCKDGYGKGSASSDQFLGG